MAVIERSVLLQKRQGADRLLLYPATLAENVLGLEGMVTECGRNRISVQPTAWTLNVDGNYVCDLTIEGLETSQDVEVLLLPTGESAAALMGGTIRQGGVTLLSGMLPEGTVDLLLKIKSVYGRENEPGIVVVLNAGGAMGAVYV